MSSILLTALVAVVFLVLLYAVWGGIHMLAQGRLGFRRMGCRGPRTDAEGNRLCCRTGEACERLEEEPSPGEARKRS